MDSVGATQMPGGARVWVVENGRRFHLVRHIRAVEPAAECAAVTQKAP